MERLKKIITNKNDREFYIHCVNDGIKIERALSLYELSKKYDHLMKSNSIVASGFLNSKINGLILFDEFSSKINHSIIQNKSNKLMKKVFSSKTKPLINELTKSLFFEFATNNIGDVFFEQFKKKTSAFKSSEKLNESLKKSLKQLSNWSFYEKKQYINTFNTTIVSEDNNSIIFEINDYDACKNLGTEMWCIVREKETFESYRDEVDRVYFKYDYNYDPESINSMTAYIVSADGSIKNGYYKDDSFMPEELANENDKYMPVFTGKDLNSRLEMLGFNESQIKLSYFNHNYGHLLKDESFDLNIKDVEKNILNLKISNENILKLIKFDKQFNRIENEFNPLFNNKDSLIFSNSIIERLTRNYKLDTTEILNEMIDNKFLNKIEKNTFVFIDDFYSIDLTNKEDADLFDVIVKNKGSTIEKELIDFYKSPELLHCNSIYEYADNKNIDLFNLFKDLDEKKMCNIIDSFFFNKITKNTNFKDVFDFSVNHKNEIKSFNNIYKKAIDLNIDVSNVEFDLKSSIKEELIIYCKNSPTKLFVKKSALKNNEIVFNKDDSLYILKKAFFENPVCNIKDLNRIDLFEDVTDPAFNMLNKQLLFSDHLNFDAQKEFVSELKSMSSSIRDQDKKEYDASVNDFHSLIKKIQLKPKL